MPHCTPFAVAACFVRYGPDTTHRGRTRAACKGKFSHLAVHMSRGRAMAHEHIRICGYRVVRQQPLPCGQASAPQTTSGGAPASLAAMGNTARPEERSIEKSKRLARARRVCLVISNNDNAVRQGKDRASGWSTASDWQPERNESRQHESRHHLLACQASDDCVRVGCSKRDAAALVVANMTEQVA